MNVSSLVGHVLDLQHIIEHSLQQGLRNDRKKSDQLPPHTKPADKIVGDFLRSRTYLGARDRRFINEATFGLIRFNRRITALLNQFVQKHPSYTSILDAQSGSTLPSYVAYVVAVEEASPAEAVDAIRSRWQLSLPNIDLNLFADWLERNRKLEFLDGNETEQLATWYSFQDWMVREWLDEFGLEESEELLNALNSQAPVTLRVNTLRIDREECQALLKEEGIETEASSYAPRGLVAAKRFNALASESFRRGYFEVQDEGSQLICLLANPQPGMMVIDACTGAGGKALAMAELMRNEGTIIGIDSEPRRLRELHERAERLGISIVQPIATVSLDLDALREKADLVLIDAPCSGTGTIRRNPSLKWSVSEAHVQHYAAIQKELLAKYSLFVKPGGTLVYSTCSLIREENESVFEQFLSGTRNFRPHLLTDTASKFGILKERESPFVRLLPHRHGTDGFFFGAATRTT